MSLRSPLATRTTAAQTTARKRRDQQTARIAGSTGRRQMWAVMGWLMAEAEAAPDNERHQMLEDLQAIAEAMNERRGR